VLEKERHDLYQSSKDHNQDTGNDQQTNIFFQGLVRKKPIVFISHF
jgi:hypothetical protein